MLGLLLGVASAVDASSASAAAYNEAAAHTFLELASAAYCNGAGLAEWTCKPCLASKLAAKNVSVFGNDKHNMHAFTALLPGSALDTSVEGEGEAPIIAIAFKGTHMSSIKNWIENLRVVKSDREMSCEGCEAHIGFIDLWESLSVPLIAEVGRLLAAHPGARIVLTGHSMGGAVAVVAAYALQRDLGLPVSGPVYTYGGPRVGNAEFAAQFSRLFAKDAPIVWRLTHHRDPIPHLPLESMGFRHVGHEVFYDEQWQHHTVCAGYGEDNKCSDSLWVADSVEDHLYYFAEEVGVCK